MLSFPNGEYRGGYLKYIYEDRRGKAEIQEFRLTAGRRVIRIIANQIR